jgi:hypothetical protein
MEIVPGNCAPAGTHFDFTGTGFTPGEQVSLYVTDPDGQVVGAPYTLTADVNGRAGPEGYGSLPDAITGIWLLGMDGQTSSHHAKGYFKLTPP